MAESINTRGKAVELTIGAQRWTVPAVTVQGQATDAGLKSALTTANSGRPLPANTDIHLNRDGTVAIVRGMKPLGFAWPEDETGT